MFDRRELLGSGAAMLGAMARETTRVRLGTGVTNPYLRHPALLAASSSTLDLVSGGRSFLGLGRGQEEWYREALGIPVGKPTRALRETFDLLDQWWAGAIMLLGLGLASRRVLVAAAAGSAIGTLTAWAIGAPASQITAGIYGYNAVLVAIALGATFLAPTAINRVFVVVACVFSTVLTATMANLFAPVGGHTLTWPFNLTAWAFLAAVPVFNAITTPNQKEASAS